MMDKALAAADVGIAIGSGSECLFQHALRMLTEDLYSQVTWQSRPHRSSSFLRI